jgi:hypothetical protein
MEDVIEDDTPFDPTNGEGAESSLYVVQPDYDDKYPPLPDIVNK